MAVILGRAGTLQASWPGASGRHAGWEEASKRELPARQVGGPAVGVVAVGTEPRVRQKVNQPQAGQSMGPITDAHTAMSHSPSGVKASPVLPVVVLCLQNLPSVKQQHDVLPSISPLILRDTWSYIVTRTAQLKPRQSGVRCCGRLWPTGV